MEKASVDEAYLDLTSLVDQRIQLVREEKVKPTDLQDTFIAGFSPPDSYDEGVYFGKPLYLHTILHI